MKIIDTRTDYYDFAGGGFDDTIVYDRRDLVSMRIEGTLGLPETDSLSTLFRSEKVWVAPSYVLVGGYGIPCARMTMEPGDAAEQSSFHYDATSLEDEVRRVFSGIGGKHGRSVLREIMTSVREMSRHFERGRQDLTDFCVTHRFVTGTVERLHKSWWPKNDEPKCVYNPVLLRDVELERVLPAQEAHMLVSRFIGGVLTERRDPEGVSDQDRIVKAGFDLKQSFRKRPEKAG